MTKRAANFWEDKFENYRTDTWYWRIRRGVPGTQMPRWEFDLSPEQTLYLVAFQKYISQNKGLGALKGMDAPVYGLLLVRLKPLYNLLTENLTMANEDKNLHEPAEEVSGTQILHGKAPFFSLLFISSLFFGLF